MYWYLKDTVADLVLYYHLVAPFTSIFLFRSGHLLKCTESGHLLLKCHFTIKMSQSGHFSNKMSVSLLKYPDLDISVVTKMSPSTNNIFAEIVPRIIII